MFLGLSFMWWALFGAIALSALLAIGWVQAMEHSDARARARRGKPITIQPSLPPMKVVERRERTEERRALDGMRRW